MKTFLWSWWRVFLYTILLHREIMKSISCCLNIDPLNVSNFTIWQITILNCILECVNLFPDARSLEAHQLENLYSHIKKTRLFGIGFAIVWANIKLCIDWNMFFFQKVHILRQERVNFECSSNASSAKFPFNYNRI